MGRWLTMIWIGLSIVYAAFTYCPAVRIFSLWSLVHIGVVGCIGTVAIAAPVNCHIRHFLVPDVAAYHTISRYYGVLILGMSCIAAAASTDAARPVWRSLQLGFSSMFAASGLCLGAFLVERGQLDLVGGGSMLMFVGLAA